MAEVADQLRAETVGRRGHLRQQPEHQLHQCMHVQVQVLRLLQGPAVPQPPGEPVPARAERDLRPGAGGRGPGGHRGLSAGGHPPQLRRRVLPRRDQGRPPGLGDHPHPRVHRPRGHRRGPPLGDAAGRVPGPAARRRPQDPAGHGRRDPGRPRAGHAVPRQDQHRGVAVRPPHRPRGGPAFQRDHHVRSRRAVPILGPAPHPDPGPPTWRRAGSPSSSPSPSSTWPRPSTCRSGPVGDPPSARRS